MEFNSSGDFIMTGMSSRYLSVSACRVILNSSRKCTLRPAEECSTHRSCLTMIAVDSLLPKENCICLLSPRQEFKNFRDCQRLNFLIRTQIGNYVNTCTENFLVKSQYDYTSRRMNIVRFTSICTHGESCPYSFL